LYGPERRGRQDRQKFGENSRVAKTPWSYTGELEERSLFDPGEFAGMMLFIGGVFVGWLLAWAFEVWFWRMRRREPVAPRIYLADNLRLSPRGPGAKAGPIGAELLSAPIGSDPVNESPQAVVMMEDSAVVEPAPGRAPETLRLSEVLRPRRTDPVVGGATARVYVSPRLHLAEPAVPVVAPRVTTALLEREPEAVINPEDDFTRINGIGPVYQKRLKLANVRSFRDLACTHPATILAIIQPRHPNMVQVHQWVAEARALARAE
jgi:predicted flap endonuclease-1-like 5' DNA nuclease